MNFTVMLNWANYDCIPFKPYKFQSSIKASRGFRHPKTNDMEGPNTRYDLRRRVARTKTTRLPELANHVQVRPDQSVADSNSAEATDNAIAEAEAEPENAAAPSTSGTANGLNNYKSNFSLINGTYSFYGFNKCKLTNCKIDCINNNLVLPLNHFKSSVSNNKFTICTNRHLSCDSKECSLFNNL